MLRHRVTPLAINYISKCTETIFHTSYQLIHTLLVKQLQFFHHFVKLCDRPFRAILYLLVVTARVEEHLMVSDTIGEMPLY